MTEKKKSPRSTEQLPQPVMGFGIPDSMAAALGMDALAAEEILLRARTARTAADGDNDGDETRKK
ncbi:MAG: hypothetical protein J6S76_04630 [Clostridia bacterium]|nr:hypothetical protein [Clostridia bacterium]